MRACELSLKRNKKALLKEVGHARLLSRYPRPHALDYALVASIVHLLSSKSEHVVKSSMGQEKSRTHLSLFVFGEWPCLSAQSDDTPSCSTSLCAPSLLQ